MPVEGAVAARPAKSLQRAALLSTGSFWNDLPAAMIALIITSGPISGAHQNLVVTVNGLFGGWPPLV